MRLFILCFCLLSYPFFAHSQQHAPFHFFKSSDTLQPARFRTICIGQAAIWGSSMYILNKSWYANYPRSRFHLFNDIGEWNQIDKVGHAWSAYFGAQLSAGLFRWSGVSQQRAALYGAGMGIAYESVIEILDGFSQEWGFSLGDMAANTSGSLLFALQEVAWKEQRIQFKFSFHRIQYDDPELHAKANQLYGNTLAQRGLKDYNGQAYWLSVSPAAFAPQSKFPAWLNIAVGYGAGGLFGGYDNDWIDSKTGIRHNRSDVARYRQFFVAPDIDLSKVKIKGRTPRVFKMLNGLKLKFPLPTLEWNTKGQWLFHPIYF